MNLLTEAIRYARRGINVIPVNGKKPVTPWKRYQVRRVTKPELVRLFKRHAGQITGLAILTGRNSRHWVCRDFDKAGAYEAWAVEYSELARILPTVKTGRGHHVYFRCFGSIPTVKLGDGELRGEKAYTLLAPSLHPNGSRYAWTNPKGLWSCHYPFYVDETGLNKSWVPALNDTHEVLGGEGLGLDEGLSKEGCGQEGLGGESVGKQSDDKLQEIQFLESKEHMTLERAVEIALPKAHSTNHWSLHALQRCLLTMKIQGALGKGAFKELQKSAFVEWLEQNAFLDPKQSEDDYFNEFVECGKHAKVPYGVGALSLAWDRASQAEPDEAAKLFRQPKKQRLVLLCRELQRLQGDKPFFLSVRSAAKFVKIPIITVSRWLKEFEAAGVIRRTRMGGIEDKQASEFQYIRNSPLADAPPPVVVPAEMGQSALAS